MGDLTFFGVVMLLGFLAIGAIIVCFSDEPVTQGKKQGDRIIAEAQAVATAEDERLAQDLESSSVMQAFEQVAAAAWRGKTDDKEVSE